TSRGMRDCCICSRPSMTLAARKVDPQLSLLGVPQQPCWKVTDHPAGEETPSVARQLQRTPDGQQYLPQFKSTRIDCRRAARGASACRETFEQYSAGRCGFALR